MPVYEFRCRECNATSERLCPVGSTGKGMKCPNCGAAKMRRIMSVFAIRTTGEVMDPESSLRSSAPSSSGTWFSRASPKAGQKGVGD